MAKTCWYFITTFMCPVCGKEQVYRERMNTSKPKKWEKRRNLIQQYDYCNE